jgi:hypothetical protein
LISVHQRKSAAKIPALTRCAGAIGVIYEGTSNMQLGTIAKLLLGK